MARITEGTQGAAQPHRPVAQPPPDATVRLWLKRSLCEPGKYRSLLDRLLRCTTGGGIDSRYRFVGACQERKAGVEYVCMSFAVERRPPCDRPSGGRVAVD